MNKYRKIVIKFDTQGTGIINWCRLGAKSTAEDTHVYSGYRE